MASGETIKCPHCECKVNISDVENDDGCCPECGQLVMASSLDSDFDDGLDDIDADMDEDMDGAYDDGDSLLDDDDDDLQPDILDELTGDFDLDDEDERPRNKRHRGSMTPGDYSAPPSRKSGESKRGRGRSRK